MKNFYDESAEDVCSNLNTNKNGLSSSLAEERLKQFGENKLKEAKKKSIISRFFAQFKDVMIILLLVSAVISLLFSIFSDGSSELVDAIIIFVIVILNATLGTIQETKAENAMESLKKMSQPYSKVIRDGKEVLIKTNELVVGDIVILEAGDVVPADLRLIECASLKCDESALTGESNAVEKDANLILPLKTALGDRKNMCFSSSVIVYGRGLGVIVATGQNAEIGKIANMLSQEEKETTTLQASLNKLGKILTIVVLCIAFVIFMVDIFITKLHWTESLMTAVAIAVAAIPESLMVVVTIILSIGVTKLAKKNVIIRRLHAVETLGCCEIICSDKTGTITQNKMTVKTLFANNTILDLNKLEIDSTTNILLQNMTLCNDAKMQDDQFLGDPTETALIAFTNKLGMKKLSLEAEMKRVNEIPFDSQRKLMSTLNLSNGIYWQFTKGAIDELLLKCSNININGKEQPLLEKDKQLIKKANEQFCAKAMRVLAFAYRKATNKDDIVEQNLTFVGLVGMIDPPREEVFDAIKKCKTAGMLPVMITGDHKNTAYAIAKELEIVTDISQVVDGNYLDNFTDEQLKTEIWKYRVFTRVSPEHKVRIVKAFRANGKVVAMTGDGVNDAPSIKSANIGIGMGKTGTEVTKEVADMILTDDNFATIVVAVEEGRKIYSNIQKTIQFLIGCNIAEVIAIFALTLIFPNITFLVAVQILFINLVTDSLPAIALGMEKVERDVMSHKPRRMNENIIGGRIGFNIIYQGIVQALIVIAVFVLGKFIYNNEVAATMGFLTLNLIQLVQMFNVRTNHSIFKTNPLKNQMMNISLAVGLILIGLISFIPPIAAVFHLATLNFVQWIIVIAFSLLIIPIVEVVKLIQNHYHHKNKKHQ